jgi:hypothetical protein
MTIEEDPEIISVPQVNRDLHGGMFGVKDGVEREESAVEIQIAVAALAMGVGVADLE